MAERLTDEMLRVIERDANSCAETHRAYTDPSEIVLLVAEIRELRAENARLREYAQHIEPCATVEGWTECTCGLEKLIGKDGT